MASRGPWSPESSIAARGTRTGRGPDRHRYQPVATGRLAGARDQDGGQGSQECNPLAIVIECIFRRRR